MKKFNEVVNKVYFDILSEAQTSIPQDGGPVQPGPSDDATAAVPDVPTDTETTPAPAQQQAAPLTSEGKKFLVELALKALAVDPDLINAADKNIFETKITLENADEIADRIRQITEGL